MSDREEMERFYQGAPRDITVKKCGARAVLDWDGAGYRCLDCFAVVGSMGCSCTWKGTQDE